MIGTHPFVRPPFRFATIDRWNRTASPTLGQHNREVLTELGLSNDEITALEREQVIGTRPIGL